MSRSSSTAIIEDLAERIGDWLDAESREPEVKSSALQALREIGTEGEDLEMLLSENAKEEFIVTFLGVEQVRFNADTPAEIPEWVVETPWADADSVRADPLCECNNHCNVKRARLTGTVQNAPTIDAGIRELKQTHPGYPTALIQANDAFNRKLARARVELQTILAALSSNIEVDELRDRDGDTEADSTPADDAASETATGAD